MGNTTSTKAAPLNQLPHYPLDFDESPIDKKRATFPPYSTLFVPLFGLAHPSLSNYFKHCWLNFGELAHLSIVDPQAICLRHLSSASQVSSLGPSAYYSLIPRVLVDPPATSQSTGSSSLSDPPSTSPPPSQSPLRSASSRRGIELISTTQVLQDFKSIYPSRLEKHSRLSRKLKNNTFNVLFSRYIYEELIYGDKVVYYDGVLKPAAPPTPSPIESHPLKPSIPLPNCKEANLAVPPTVYIPQHNPTPGLRIIEYGTTEYYLIQHPSYSCDAKGLRPVDGPDGFSGVDLFSLYPPRLFSTTSDQPVLSFFLKPYIMDLTRSHFTFHKYPTFPTTFQQRPFTFTLAGQVEELRNSLIKLKAADSKRVQDRNNAVETDLIQLAFIQQLLTSHMPFSVLYLNAQREESRHALYSFILFHLYQQLHNSLVFNPKAPVVVILQGTVLDNDTMLLTEHYITTTITQFLNINPIIIHEGINRVIRPESELETDFRPSKTSSLLSTNVAATPIRFPVFKQPKNYPIPHASPSSSSNSPNGLNQLNVMASSKSSMKKPIISANTFNSRINMYYDTPFLSPSPITSRQSVETAIRTSTVQYFDSPPVHQPPAFPQPHKPLMRRNYFNYNGAALPRHRRLQLAAGQPRKNGHVIVFIQHVTTDEGTRLGAAGERQLAKNTQVDFMTKLLRPGVIEVYPDEAVFGSPAQSGNIADEVKDSFVRIVDLLNQYAGLFMVESIAPSSAHLSENNTPNLNQLTANPYLLTRLETILTIMRNPSSHLCYGTTSNQLGSSNNHILSSLQLFYQTFYPNVLAQYQWNFILNHRVSCVNIIGTQPLTPITHLSLTLPSICFGSWVYYEPPSDMAPSTVSYDFQFGMAAIRGFQRFTMEYYLKGTIERELRDVDHPAFATIAPSTLLNKRATKSSEAFDEAWRQLDYSFSSAISHLLQRYNNHRNQPQPTDLSVFCGAGNETDVQIVTIDEPTIFSADSNGTLAINHKPFEENEISTTISATSPSSDKSSISIEFTNNLPTTYTFRYFGDDISSLETPYTSQIDHFKFSHNLNNVNNNNNNNSNGSHPHTLSFSIISPDPNHLTDGSRMDPHALQVQITHPSHNLDPVTALWTLPMEQLIALDDYAEKIAQQRLRVHECQVELNNTRNAGGEERQGGSNSHPTTFLLPYKPSHFKYHIQVANNFSFSSARLHPTMFESIQSCPHFHPGILFFTLFDPIRLNSTSTGYRVNQAKKKATFTQFENEIELLISLNKTIHSLLPYFFVIILPIDVNLLQSSEDSCQPFPKIDKNPDGVDVVEYSEMSDNLSKVVGQSTKLIEILKQQDPYASRLFDLIDLIGADHDHDNNDHCESNDAIELNLSWNGRIEPSSITSQTTNVQSAHSEPITPLFSKYATHRRPVYTFVVKGFQGYLDILPFINQCALVHHVGSAQAKT